MAPKRKQLSNTVRELIVTMFKNGTTVTDINKQTNIPRTTVSTVIQKFRNSGEASTSRRSGRPQTLTAREKRRLGFLVNTSRRTPLKKIYATFNEKREHKLSKRTLDRYCRELGFTRAPNTKKQVLLKKHRDARLNWCRPRRILTVEDYWSKVIFSDESCVKIGDNYRVYVWKKRERAIDPTFTGTRKIQ